jgi:hypothetical protein
VGEGLSVCASKSMCGWRRCENTRWHPAACFIGKQVGLEFPSFVSKLAEKRRRVVHVASSWRSRGSEAKDDWFDGVRCDVVEVGPNYPSLIIIFLLVHMGIQVFCFHYKWDPKDWCRGKHSIIPLSPLTIVAFWESERSLQFSKEWGDIVVIFTPCRCLILSL